MPKYQVELTNGQRFIVDADGPPTEADIMAYVSQQAAPAAPVAAPMLPPARTSQSQGSFPPSFLSQAPEPSLMERGRQFLSPLLGPTATQTLDMQRYGTEVYEALPAWKREGIVGAMSHSPVELIPDVTAPQFKAPSPGLAPLVDLYNRLNLGQAAVINTAKGFANFAVSPPGLATAGASTVPGLARLVSGGFAADMALKTPEAAQHAGELSVIGTPQEQANANVGLAAQVLMPGLLGLHALKGGEPRGQETKGRKEVLTMGPTPDWLNPAVLEAQRGGPYPLAPLDPRTKEGPIVAPGLPTVDTLSPSNWQGPLTPAERQGHMGRAPSGLRMAVDKPVYERGDPLNPLTIDPTVSFDRTAKPSGGQAADALVDIPWAEKGGHPYTPLTENQLRIMTESLVNALGAKNQVTVSPWLKKNEPAVKPVTLLDSAIAGIEAAQKKLRGDEKNVNMGVPTAILDMALETVRLLLKSGRSIAEATQAGLNYIRRNSPNFDEGAVRIYFNNAINLKTSLPPAVSREAPTAPVETAARPSENLGPPPRPNLTESPVSTEPVRVARELTPEEMTNVRHDLAGLMVENLKALGATPEQVRDLSERRKAIGRQVQATGDMGAFNRQVADMRKEITTFVQTAKAAKAASAVPIKPPLAIGETQTTQPPLAEKPKYPLSRKGDKFVDALGRPVGPEGELLPAPPEAPGAVRESDKPLRMQPAPPPLPDAPPRNRKFVQDLGLEEGMSTYEAFKRFSESKTVGTPEQRALAGFLHKHFPDVLRMSPLSLSNPEGAKRPAYWTETHGTYLDVNNRVYDSAEMLLHEGAHAATVWQLDHPVTPVQHAAKAEILKLMERAIEALPENERDFVRGPYQEYYNRRLQGINEAVEPVYDAHGVDTGRYAIHYGLLNPKEFVAVIFERPDFRAYLDSIPAGNKTLFARIVDAFKELLGVTPDSVLDKTFDTLWHMGEDRGSVNENRRAGGRSELAEIPERGGVLPPPPPLPLSFYVADAKAALPDLKPKNVANRENSIKFASERVPLLGDLLGGKRRVKTPQDEAVATWFAEKHGVAPAVASSVGTQLSGQVDKVFGKSANGDLRVTPTVAGMSLKPSDVFETLQRDPQAYQLSTAQRKVFDTVITPLLNRARELVQRYDLAHVLDEDGNPLGYFPRIVTKRPGEMPPTGGQARVGAPQSFQQSRRFATEREGWQKGVEYETSVEKALTTYVERLYKAIADKRLIEDPTLGAQSYARLEADMRSYYAPELASGQLSEAQFKGIVSSVAAKGSVRSPAFFGRVFDPEVAKMLNREFAAERSRYTQGIATFNSVLKRVKLGFDLGGGQIQLLPTLFNNPRIWGQANALSVGALAHPSVFRWYAKNNRQYIRELAELGSPTGRIDEYVGGLAGRDPLAKVPGVAQVSGAFGRQFQTLLDVAKVEYWKAYRDTVPKSEWPRMVRTIETLVLSGRMESAMVSHYRSTTERALLLAPSYYRAATDFVAGLTESGKSGRVMQKAMGAFVVGSVATYLAFARQSGMSEDEVKKRLDPSRADFMMWDVKEGDKTITMGFGGIFRSFLRLFGNVAKTSIEHPDNWDSLSSDKNPFSRWLRGHLGPIPAGVWTMFSGKDFLGRQSKGKVTTVVKEAITPMAAAEEGGGRSKTASFFGINTMPKRSPSADELSKGRLGDMAMWERMGLGRQVKGARVPQTPEEKMMTEQRAAEYSMERTVALQKALPKDAQQWLEKNKLTLTPFTATIERKGVSVPLTTDERKKLEQLNHKWYGVYIKRLMDRQDVSAMPASRRQELLNRMLTHAREAARDELVMGLPRARLGTP